MLFLVILILAFRDSANAKPGWQQLPAGLLSGAKVPCSGAGQQRSSPAKDQGRADTSAEVKLSDTQKTLVAGSRRAMLKTGMSESYFDKHFRVVQVFDRPGDRRVVWKFSINEYEAIINDSIGYYTEGGRRIDVHSVGSLVPLTSDIRRTIPRKKALGIMAACLGKFTNPAIEYGAGPGGKATLFLTAQSVPKPEQLNAKDARERKLREREAREKAMKVKREADRDVIEEEEDGNRPPIFLGSVNLETGKCTKGVAQAGPPRTR